jgi:hypothetical protein
MVQFHGGRKPNNPNRPRLYLKSFLKAGATPPASVDFTKLPNIGMLGNDQYGDCVFAANGHIVEQQTYEGQGTEVTVSTAQALAEYSKVTGFNPNDPNTDQGAEVQQGLDDLRKSGLNGHKIAAFAQVDVTNMNEVKLAVAEFGAVDIGFNFPDSAMDQFNNGQPWDVVKGSPLDGGHCVVVVGYDSNYLLVYTWGAVQKMTYAFWTKYVEEAWALVDQDAFNATSGKTFTGVDLATFGAQFAALTGQPNPFPDAPTPTPSPAPTPVPDPAPSPSPVVDDETLALAAALHRDLKGRNVPSYLVKAAKAWLAKENL